MPTVLPIRVMFQNGHGIRQVLIEANEQGLGQLAEALIEGAAEVLTLPPLAGTQQAPDVVGLGLLRVMAGDLPLRVQVMEDAIVISGSLKTRRLLADNIAFLQGQAAGGPIAPHIHFDFVPGFTPELHPESESLVITKL